MSSIIRPRAGFRKNDAAHRQPTHASLSPPLADTKCSHAAPWLSRFPTTAPHIPPKPPFSSSQPSALMGCSTVQGEGQFYQVKACP